MIWADRVAIVWALILWGGMALLAGGHGHSEDAFHPEVLKAVALLAGGPWLLLRGLDFICGGPMRRADARYFQNLRRVP